MSDYKSENDRQYRIIDQMLSMHALARDDNYLKSQTLDVFLLLFSTITCSLLFAETKIALFLDVDENIVEIFTATTSVFVFFFSLLENKLDWKEKTTLHRTAINKLSDLKALYRDAYDRGIENIELKIMYNNTMKEIIEIPEKNFIKYKAKHLYKRKLSEELSKKPGISIIFMKLKIKLGKN